MGEALEQDIQCVSRRLEAVRSKLLEHLADGLVRAASKKRLKDGIVQRQIVVGCGVGVLAELVREGEGGVDRARAKERREQDGERPI